MGLQNSSQCHLLVVLHLLGGRGGVLGFALGAAVEVNLQKVCEELLQGDADVAAALLQLLDAPDGGVANDVQAIRLSQD